VIYLEPDIYSAARARAGGDDAGTAASSGTGAAGERSGK
jgi:hypothetical protein